MKRKDWIRSNPCRTAGRRRNGVAATLVAGLVGVVFASVAGATQIANSCPGVCCATPKEGAEVFAPSSVEHASSALACNLNGLTAQQQERRVAIWAIVKPQIHEVQERASGYAFRFETSDRILAEIAELVTLEMRCCPFLQFEVVVSEDGGPIWLHLSGREGVKEFLAAMIAAES